MLDEVMEDSEYVADGEVDAGFELMDPSGNSRGPLASSARTPSGKR
ncbi:hypothetical protein STRIP9103_00853 [Streptomyces ipomoeae 91-03]|uniref:Uncharacterized protein n=1 Tax=Streptomyces ipomoeae 91-03 TaxID=698759 RepID=L1KZ75_9ACTN|nr:hypothetical protein STRIP9103_00853 [Streptomyces ipomoeae 91-03]